MKLCKLMLAFPSDAEDALLAVLASHSPELPGYTILNGDGHGFGFERADIHERVRGRVERMVLMSVMPCDHVSALVAALRKVLPRQDIAWWTEAVLDFGRLA